MEPAWVTNRLPTEAIPTNNTITEEDNMTKLGAKAQKTREMFGVEYYTEPDHDHSTYEIFPTLEKALKFGKKRDVLYIFRADFNTERIFIEDGSWNYEDKSDTFQGQRIICVPITEDMIREAQKRTNCQ